MFGTILSNLDSQIQRAREAELAPVERVNKPRGGWDSPSHGVRVRHPWSPAGAVHWGRVGEAAAVVSRPCMRFFVPLRYVLKRLGPIETAWPWQAGGKNRRLLA